MSTSISPAQTAIRAVLEARRQQPGALLPILHDIQDRLGHVPPEAVPEIAEARNLSRAEVHGVPPSTSTSAARRHVRRGAHPPAR